MNTEEEKLITSQLEKNRKFAEKYAIAYDIFPGLEGELDKVERELLVQEASPSTTDSIVDGFQRALTEYQNACENGALTSAKAKELQRTMRTGSSPAILQENKEALETFVEHYEAADEGQQKKWKEAKELAEQQLTVLKEKEKKAGETVEAWENQMRSNGIQGYFKYAEGVVNGELIRKMDWCMASTAAMEGNVSGVGDLGQGAQALGDNSYNGAEIRIETYTLTEDENGDLIYTPSNTVSQFTTRMKELAARLTSPHLADAENYDMKPGGLPPFETNEGGPDPASSQLLRTAAKPTPETVEIPDWTDGRVVEMMEEYKRDCAAGLLPPSKVKARKVAMSETILKEQGALIVDLEKIHEDLNKPEDTKILLNLWKQKVEAWKERVKNLGEDCFRKAAIEEVTTGFEDLYTKYTNLCKAGILPTRIKDELKANMQADIDRQRASMTPLQEQLSFYAPMAGDPTVDIEIKKLKDEIKKINTRIENQQHRLDHLRDDCFSEIIINAQFLPDSNTLINESEILSDLQKIVNLMEANPELIILVEGDYQGREQSLINVKEDKGKYAIDEYDATDLDSEDGKVKTSADVAMLRALTLKELILSMNSAINPNNIETEVGDFETEMRARISVK